MASRKPRRSEQLRAALKTAEQVQQEKAKLYHARLKQAVNEIAATEAGRFFFHDLMQFCSFGRTKIVADTVSKTVDNDSTAHNAAMENVYLRYRRNYLRREHLIKIEFSKQED